MGRQAALEELGDVPAPVACGRTHICVLRAPAEGRRAHELVGATTYIESSHSTAILVCCGTGDALGGDL